ncbi:hypothetical protein ARMSODRAFT_980399 [Armillaria solidipes]|uniref:Uncharacterized protein n=1 Tax=Armillaria solidipes TaxID=1076256 RepID=A0A2H3B1F7_9AGAR|nr:hypothetical protein ARMSODRAFT_980890 [Armillaria solidipes]PBK62744.1 hypothetical protein ARMSODRAFT_980399 [Armillaria solidipes]
MYRDENEHTCATTVVLVLSAICLFDIYWSLYAQGELNTGSQYISRYARESKAENREAVELVVVAVKPLNRASQKRQPALGFPRHRRVSYLHVQNQQSACISLPPVQVQVLNPNACISDFRTYVSCADICMIIADHDYIKLTAIQPGTMTTRTTTYRALERLG